jgi:predicted GTPase
MEKLFNIKYKPKKIDDFELDDSLKYLFKNLIEMDSISVMLIGNSGSGKSSLINVLINEYYKDVSEQRKNDNLMTINTLREQGIQYYRNEVKIFWFIFYIKKFLHLYLI